MHFAITDQFIDEVLYEVVKLDVCQLILESPYLWEWDAIYHRCSHRYQLTKDGKKYLITSNEAQEQVDMV